MRARINKALSDGLVGGGFEIKEPKTSSSVRTVSFSAYMRDRLLEHKKQQKAYLARLRTQVTKPLILSTGETGSNYEKRKAFRRNRRQILANFKKYDLVFPSKIGLPNSRHNLIVRILKPTLKKAGLDSDKYSFKSLRHTNASIMAEKVNPKRLQKHLGHSAVTTTLGYYVHVDDDAQSEFSDRFVEELY